VGRDDGLPIERLLTLIAVMTESIRTEVLAAVEDRDRAKLLLEAIQGRVSQALALPPAAEEDAPTTVDGEATRS
jgi:hypothetical protein